MRDRHCQWTVRPFVIGGRSSPPPMAWLRARRSLTVRLRRSCGDAFSVHVLAEGWHRPMPDEARRLRIRVGRLAWIREVLLKCGDCPVMYARTVVPEDSLRGRNREIRRLGDRPLGEVLFAGRGTRRSTPEVAHVGRDHWLLYRVRSAASEGVALPERLWSRRVVHRLRGKPLLLSEVFFPELINHDH